MKNELFPTNFLNTIVKQANEPNTLETFKNMFENSFSDEMFDLEQNMANYWAQFKKDIEDFGKAKCGEPHFMNEIYSFVDNTSDPFRRKVWQIIIRAVEYYVWHSTETDNTRLEWVMANAAIKGGEITREMVDEAIENGWCY